VSKGKVQKKFITLKKLLRKNEFTELVQAAKSCRPVMIKAQQENEELRKL